MKKIIAFIILLFALTPDAKLFAQTNFEVPSNVNLEKKEDYTKYETDIITAADWLEETPFNEQKDKRRKVNAFVAVWVLGSPTVTITMTSTLTDFDKKNTGMMVLYMAAYSKYVLKNNYSKDVKAAKTAALKSLIKVYTSGKGISRDKKMEKLVQADTDGKLDDWINENMKE